MAAFPSRLLKRKNSGEKSWNIGSADNEEKSKSMLALTVVILLFIVAIVMVSYGYSLERAMRVELETENKLNIEVIHACDRMQLRQIQIEKLEMATEETPCESCIDCEADLKQKLASDAIKHEQELQLAMTELDHYRAAVSELEGEHRSQLMRGLQKVSKEVLLLEYGPPPYYVEIDVSIPKFPPRQTSDNKVDAKVDRKNRPVETSNMVQKGTLQLQMAPIDEVPYSILYFLTHISNGAWNGCSFATNAGHIIIADVEGTNCHPELFDLGAKPTGGGRGANTFITRKLAFQEYSDHFPHKQYTVGFSGRPGGPQFYINTMDNADFHGPGGQPKVEFPEEADVCYAKVSGGVELLQNMMDVPVVGIRLIQPVIITDTRIVSL